MRRSLGLAYCRQRGLLSKVGTVLSGTPPVAVTLHVDRGPFWKRVSTQSLRYQERCYQPECSVIGDLPLTKAGRVSPGTGLDAWLLGIPAFPCSMPTLIDLATRGARHTMRIGSSTWSIWGTPRNWTSPASNTSRPGFLFPIFMPSPV